MDKTSLLRQLAGLPIPDIRYFDTIGSTNDVALEWAAEGAADGSVVVADQQTMGRGRLGRSWVTNPGAALAFTLVIRPTPAEVENLGLFSPLAGLSVCQALLSMGLPAEIKWPNDVLLDRMKTCGILAESSWQGDSLSGVVVGIGINVAPSSVPPSEQVQFPATCIEAHLGGPVDRIQLLQEIIKEFTEWRKKLASPGFFEAWEGHLAFKGEQVQLKNSGLEMVSGKLLGVNSRGDLRILLPNGSEREFTVGDVHLRPERS